MSKGRIPFNRKQYRHQNYSYIISFNIHIVFAARRGTALECWLTIPWAIQNMDIAPKGQRPIQIYIYIELYREVIEHDGTRSGHAFGHLKWNPLKIDI